MGSPLGPVLANIIMTELEKKQIGGVSMGSSLGPVLENIIMTEMEKIIVKDLVDKSLRNTSNKKYTSNILTTPYF